MTEPSPDVARAPEGPSAAERAIRNTASMLASRVAIAAMGWAGTMIIARSLSATEWGEFSFIFGLLGMMSIFTDLGVGRVVLERLQRDDEAEVSRVALSFIVLRLVLGLVGYAVAVLFVVASGYSSRVIYATVVAGLVVVIATPSHAFSVLFQSRLKMTYVAVAETLGQLMQLACTIAAALIAPWLIIFVIPAVVNEVVAIGVKLRGARAGAAGPRPHGPLEIWRWTEMLKEAIPLTIGFLFVEVSWRVGILILARVDEFDAVGLYSIGYKFADLVLVAALAVINPFTTLMVSSWPDPAGFRAAVHRAAAIIAVMCAAGTAAFWPVAEPLLALLYGPRFGEAGLAGRLLLVAASLSALAHLGLMALVSAGQHRLYPWVTVLALATNVGLNFVLIPRISFNGAAWANLVGEAVMLGGIALIMALTLRVRGVLPIRNVLGPAAIATLVIAVASLAPGVPELPWPVLATICGTVTLIVAHLCGLTGGLSVRSAWQRIAQRGA